MRRILVVRACAIGDFVLNIPALQALYSGLNNDVALTLLGYPARLELARLFIPEAIESIHFIESQPWSGLFNGPVTNLTFDSAIVWMRDPTVAQNMRLSGISDVLHASPFPGSSHAAGHLLGTLGLPMPPLPDLWQPCSNRIMLHPGSGSFRKCWPYFHELADRMKEPVFIVGPNESNFRSRHPCLSGLSLLEVAAELRRYRAYVGNDSGITHLAAYLGVPTTALFGPTDPHIWGPLGKRVRILSNPSLDAISVEDVLQYAQSEI
jgi:ADP-heptose:LPS heptosyltransferase